MMSLDKDSPACRQMRSQMAAMDPAAQCANAGAQRAQCEARMRAALEQMNAMCR